MSLDDLAINLLNKIFTCSDQNDRTSSEDTIFELCEKTEGFLKILANIMTIERIPSNLYFFFADSFFC